MKNKGEMEKCLIFKREGAFALIFPENVIQ